MHFASCPSFRGLRQSTRFATRSISSPKQSCRLDAMEEIDHPYSHLGRRADATHTPRVFLMLTPGCGRSLCFHQTRSLPMTTGAHKRLELRPKQVGTKTLNAIT